MRTQNKKGFTLAELLIVVAILGVLVAVAIPVFTTSLEKAKKAVDDANFRSAQAVANILELKGEITVEGAGTVTKDMISYHRGKALYLLNDGSFSIAPAGTPPDNAYRKQVKDKDYPVDWVIQILASLGSDSTLRVIAVWQPDV